MEKQTVAISLPKNILQQAKNVAVQRNISLSDLLVQALSDFVTQSEKYDEAQERYLALLKDGVDLGTKGEATWSRRELHEH